MCSRVPCKVLNIYDLHFFLFLCSEEKPEAEPSAVGVDQVKKSVSEEAEGIESAPGRYLKTIHTFLDEGE